MHHEEQENYAEIYIRRHGGLPTYDELNEVERSLILRGCTYEAIAWRRIKIGNFKSESKFNENFPVDAATAFLSSTNDAMFNTKRINMHLNSIYEKQTIPMPEDLPESLIGYFGNQLLMWGKPVEDTEYYIGVDCSEGLGKNSDYSVMEIITLDGEQVGEFRSNKIRPFVFAQLVNDLGKYFNDGMLVVEKASAGHAVLSKLKDDFEYYNLYRSRQYDERGRARRKDGFSTNTKTKPKMIDDFAEWFDNGSLKINSKQLLTEMLAFSYKDGKREAATGHDDTVMAMAMAIQAAREGKYYA
ncbi:MAG: hypothetical protein LBS21_09450 [Clostridiales bacterium]|nr:hypothetical protein [Clostridiales bacterium]